MVERTVGAEIMENVIKYAEEVFKHYSVEAIILFGSCVRGTNNEDSDIDIAIVTGNIETDVIDEELNLMRLRRKIDMRIEPHVIRKEDYDKLATPFIKEIVETGIKVA